MKTVFPPEFFRTENDVFPTVSRYWLAKERLHHIPPKTHRNLIVWNWNELEFHRIADRNDVRGFIHYFLAILYMKIEQLSDATWIFVVFHSTI